MKPDRLFNQQDPAWKAHVLGWGPNLGTIGQYGCFDCVLAMILWACQARWTPSALDVYLTARKIFVKDPTGTSDFLPDDTLDRGFPGLFKTTSYSGYQAGLIAAALASKTSFAAIQVAGFSPFWGIKILSHFILMYGKDVTADPEGGVVRQLAAYGGAGNVVQTLIIEFLPRVIVEPKPQPRPVPLPPAASSPVGQDVLPTPPAPTPIPCGAIPLPTPPPAEKSAPVDLSLQGILIALLNLVLRARGRR